MEPLKKEDEDMKEALKEDPDATPGNPSAREMLWEAFLKVPTLESELLISFLTVALLHQRFCGSGY